MMIVILFFALEPTAPDLDLLSGAELSPVRELRRPEALACRSQ